MTKTESADEITLEITTEETDDGKEEDLEKARDCKTPIQSAKELITIFTAQDDSDTENDDEEETIKCEIEPPAKKAKGATPYKKYIQKYKKEWESKPELKPWLSESVHGNTYFYCRFCKKDYKGGISDIHKHMLSKKHIDNISVPSKTLKNFKFQGLLCPVFTPFINSSVSSRKSIPDINLKAISHQAEFLKACGIKGVLINDIVGEGMSLTLKERMYLTEIWAKLCEKNHQFLMVQIGCAPFKDVVELAIHAKNTGVGALVVLPDLHNRPINHLDLIRYLKLLSEYSGDIPLLYHHNSKFIGNDNIDISAFLLDITGEIESFAGLIYSTNDLQKTTAAAAVNPGKFTIFMGTDETILGAAASGFTSIMSVSLNFIPKIVQSICDSCEIGDIKKAQTSQQSLNHTIEVIQKHGDSVAAMKTAAHIITNTCGVITREPLQTLWEGVRNKLQAKLKEIGLI